MRAAFALLAVGLALGTGLAALATSSAEPAARQGALVGLLSAFALEAWSLRRRFAAVRPGATQASFAAALVGGFLAKLVVLVGLALVAASRDLFSVPAFLLAFLAGVLWGESCAVFLLVRARRTSASGDPSPSDP